jgi:hypothetical protein
MAMRDPLFERCQVRLLYRHAKARNAAGGWTSSTIVSSTISTPAMRMVPRPMTSGLSAPPSYDSSSVNLVAHWRDGWTISRIGRGLTSSEETIVLMDDGSVEGRFGIAATLNDQTSLAALSGGVNSAA